MSGSDESIYFGREQTLIKHTILQKYLERFAIIVGQFYDSITYIDGFSGPWNCRSEKLEDASFSIALEQLRNARKTLKEKFGRDLKIRCYFIEKDKAAFEQLKAFREKQSDDVEVEVRQGEFELLVDDVIKFIKNGPAKNFPFIFIDPTGWTGFSMGIISPLLKLPKCEILINFMTSHIIRFIEAEPVEIGESFERLYGDSTFRSRFDGLIGQEREDAIVFAYAERISVVGSYAYVPVTVVPNPEKDSTHFHLVYATRNLTGFGVFKNAERQALQVTGEVRADAKRRKRERESGNLELFQGESLPDTNYTDRLSLHYRTLARAKVVELLRKQKQVPYDLLFPLALRYPFVTEQDLRFWIDEIADKFGLKPREQVLKTGCGHFVQLRIDAENLLK